MMTPNPSQVPWNNTTVLKHFPAKSNNNPTPLQQRDHPSVKQNHTTPVLYYTIVQCGRVLCLGSPLKYGVVMMNNITTNNTSSWLDFWCLFAVLSPNHSQ